MSGRQTLPGGKSVKLIRPPRPDTLQERFVGVYGSHTCLICGKPRTGINSPPPGHQFAQLRKFLCKDCCPEV